MRMLSLANFAALKPYTSAWPLGRAASALPLTLSSLRLSLTSPWARLS
jgi:hypothetical protein